ncbi:MAG: hypothetical protein JWQ63_2168 [Mucilaginibacter sp.]|jgi:hypothetical protein|nr:hypothetical protein [Mucilaginibacter sp.]
MLLKKGNKNRSAWSVTKDRADRTRKKSASAAANEDSVIAELKNREHGGEQPAR